MLTYNAPPHRNYSGRSPQFGPQYRKAQNKAFSLSLQPGRGHAIDELLVILWLIVIPLEFPMAQAFRMPVAAIMLLAAILNWRDFLPLLIKVPILFALPVMCLLSILWSDAPMAALRYGSFMALGLVICAWTAARLDHRQFVVTVLISGGILCIASMIFQRTAFVGGLDGGFATIGVYPQKNVLGVRMLFLIVAALAVIFDKGYAKRWRLFAMGLMLPALYLLARSSSATALILLLGAGALMLGLILLWRPAAQVKGLRPIIAIAAIISLSGGALFSANALRIDPVETVLEKVGKDRTLTGRTDIWRVANILIEEKPVLGLGAGSFWRPGVNKATQLSTMFHAKNNQFYFHNAYYETTVHIGFVGLGLFLLTWIMAYRILIRHWLKHQKMIDPFFIGISAILFVRSFTESELFGVFLMNPMILWVGVFLAIRSNIENKSY